MNKLKIYVETRWCHPHFGGDRHSVQKFTSLKEAEKHFNAKSEHQELERLIGAAPGIVSDSVPGIAEEVVEILEQYHQSRLSELREKVEAEKRIYEQSSDDFGDGLVQGMRHILNLIDNM